jgi:hypothetical protein
MRLYAKEQPNDLQAALLLTKKPRTGIVRALNRFQFISPMLVTTMSSNDSNVDVIMFMVRYSSAGFRF